jgi:hypothetical protein
MRCFCATVTALIVLLAGVASARAQGGDAATADALFGDGRQLSAGGRLAEACTRFEASMALVPRLGVQLNLADCYERLGRTASAWVAFGEAAALARRMADSREAFARRRNAALVPRLSRLTITIFAGAPIDDLVVIRDGALVPPAVYGLEVPVDPGEHTIEATAPGRIRWSTRLEVSHEGEVVTVAVPDLARARAEAAPLEPIAALGRRQPTPATWIVSGVGVAGLGVGAVFGIAARSLWRQASPGCDRSNACGDPAFAVAERSRRDGNVSTVAFVIGGAALVAGAGLYLRSPRGRDRRAKVVPSISPGAAGVTVAGAF